MQLATAKRTNVSGRLMEDHPAKRRRIEEPAEAAQATVAQTREAGQPSSRYNGVCWAKRERRWLASIRHEGQLQHLGYFDEEQDAARAFDEAALRLRGDQAHGRRGRQGPAWRLNFATEAQIAVAAEAEAAVEARASEREALVAQREAAGEPTSRYVGVSWHKVPRKWVASIRHCAASGSV